MIEILIASQNRNKIKELRAIFDHPEVRLMSLDNFHDDDSVVEDGATFFDNALIKAQYFSKKYNCIAISDDSGLVIPSLGGRPGIHSARYSGGDDQANNIKILDEMKDHKKRDAYFVSVIVLCYPNGVYKSYEGRAHGTIGYSEKGHHGFGYDSIFYTPTYNLHFAELEPIVKNQISHRAQALHLLKEDIDEIINYK